MKIISVLFIFSILTACSHSDLNQADQTARNPSSQQAYGIDWGRFTLDESMPSFGMYSRETVETTQKRSLIFLTISEKQKIGIPVNQLAFANFRHAKVFYVATLPGIYVDENNQILKTNNIVDKIILSEKHWGAKIRKATSGIEAHAELSIFLKPGRGIQLILNQDKLEKLRNPKLISEAVVFSIEAVRSRENIDAGFFPSALGPNFAIANRVVSSTERNMQHLEDPDRIIISNRLNFLNISSRIKTVPNPQDAMLVTALIKSNQDQRSHYYDAVTNNCTSGLFKLLDSALIYKDNKIDTNKIKQAVVKFTKKDLKEILTFLKEQKIQAAKQGTVVNESLDKAISELSQYSEQSAINHKYSGDFLSTIPAFIEGHLKARGLLK